MPALTTDSAPFLDDAKSLVFAVRRAFADLVEEIGADPAQPQELARRMGLDKSLAWKIARVIREDDAWTAVPYLPGKSGIRIFLESARKTGGSDETIAFVNATVARLDEFIQVHSGNRETFAMMVGVIGGHSEQAQPEVSEAHRKLAFRGQSATWGVQAQAQISVHFVAPADDGTNVDTAVISGLVGFRRLRHDVAWGITRVANYRGDGALVGDGIGQPLDPINTPGGAPLMPAFCSSPLPNIRVVSASDGSCKLELAEGPVGLTGSANCFTGYYYRRAGTMFKTDQDTFAEFLVSLSTPAELAIHDVYIHKRFAAVMPPSISVYSNLPAAQSFDPAARDKGLIPVGEKVTRLGNHPSKVVVPEFGLYGQMVATVFERLGWREDEFSGFRLRLRYPPVPSIAVFRFPLLDRP